MQFQSGNAGVRRGLPLGEQDLHFAEQIVPNAREHSFRGSIQKCDGLARVLVGQDTRALVKKRDAVAIYWQTVFPEAKHWARLLVPDRDLLVGIERRFPTGVLQDYRRGKIAG